MFIFRSVFEIKSSYQIKHLILHPRVRIWPQDLRWVSSLRCRKHHNVNNVKLGCSTRCNFSSAAEFHWAGIWDESSGVRQAAGLREDSFEPHQPCCLLPTYCPAKEVSDLANVLPSGTPQAPRAAEPWASRKGQKQGGPRTKLLIWNMSVWIFIWTRKSDVNAILKGIQECGKRHHILIFFKSHLCHMDRKSSSFLKNNKVGQGKKKSFLYKLLFIKTWQETELPTTTPTHPLN